MKKKAFFTMLAVVLVLVLSLTVFVACNKDKKDNTGETPATYSVTVNGGTGGGEYTAGATVKITANAPETGKEFTSWTIEGVTVDDKTEAEITFTMPANAVTATANYEYIDYTVTVNGGTADKTTAHYGDSVTITANEIDGQIFNEWIIVGFDTTDLDLTQNVLTFTMPANEVTATAVFEDVYEMALENCTSDKEVARHGEPVTFTAGEYEGKRFTGWYIKGVDTTGLDLTKSPLTINMPANDIVVAAQYEDIYKITIGHGCTTDKEYAAEGEEVTVTKPAPETGFATRWQTTGIDKKLDNSQHTVTFKMPANDIVINYINVLLNFSFVINNGTASGLKFNNVESVTDGSTGFDYNCDVTITANEPETGKRFTSWTITGVDTSELVLTDRELTFTMPAGNVTATANYDLINYTVSVNGGTAKVNGVETATAHYGDTVTITANEPGTNKEFIGWNSPDGVEFNNKTSTETTFIMPASNVTVNAVFGDINKYSVFVNYDSGGAASDSQRAYCGDPVTITAKDIEGRIFVRWEIKNLNTEGLDLTRAELSFTMPANNVTANAIYEDLITLTFEGNIAQSERLTYRKGASKTFRIELGDSQELCEYDISLTNKSCTFRVYDSLGNEIEPTDNGDGSMRIAVNRQDTYTIRVTYEGTSSTTQCAIKITASSPTV